MGTTKLITCPGCGARVADSTGPTHAYMGAAPGCWALFGRILAREYNEYWDPLLHHLSVDAYAVQHPGEPSSKTIQSVAVHLISLYRLIECGYDADAVTDAMRQALQHRDLFLWLDPPSPPGELTVLDVVSAPDQHAYEEQVRRWAASAWEAWASHHARIKKWAEAR